MIPLYYFWNKEQEVLKNIFENSITHHRLSCEVSN